jgi:mRNA-degrading endonuclease toxin of MazEF toxin-antitoxin module
MKPRRASINPRRSEIWINNLEKPNQVIKHEDYALPDERVGSEQAKIRPAVVISIESFSNLPVCTIVPFGTWQTWHNEQLWFIPIEPDSSNNLKRTSSALCSQIQTVSYQRFEKYIGDLSDDLVALGIQYECP